MIAVAASPFELWANREGYNIAPAVVPSDIRQYADRGTQAAFEAWEAALRSLPQVTAHRYRISAPVGIAFFEEKLYTSERSARIARTRILYGRGLRDTGFDESHFPIVPEDANA